MKLAALATLFVPGMAFAAWTTTDFPAFTEEGTGRFISQKVVEKGVWNLQSFGDFYYSFGNTHCHLFTFYNAWTCQ